MDKKEIEEIDEKKESLTSLDNKANYYGRGEVLPLTDEEKIKRFVLIAFPVVFFIIAVILTAIYN